MADMKIFTDGHGHVLGTHTFARGFTPAKPAQLVRLSEEQATCHAAWLEKHTSWEAAAEFIDDWATGRLFVSH